MINSIQTLLAGLAAVIVPLFIFIICCYYVIKQAKSDSVLLTIGSGGSLLLTIFYSIAMPYLIQVSYLSVESVSSYYMISSVIGFIFNAIFAIGLLLLVLKTIGTSKSFPYQFPPSGNPNT